MQDPLLVRRRGRPRGAANFVRPSQASSQQSTQQSTQESRQNITFNQSTQRELSVFERVKGEGEGEGEGVELAGGGQLVPNDHQGAPIAVDEGIEDRI
ncbi:hypothetical protein N7448_011275 [Penicillium atrosanguineum]|nr:hypothetical protein N7448_011275 [Penicillium atrosanguineum]